MLAGILRAAIVSDLQNTSMYAYFEVYIYKKYVKYTHKSQSSYKLFTLCTIIYIVLTHL